MRWMMLRCGWYNLAAILAIGLLPLAAGPEPGRDRAPPPRAAVLDPCPPPEVRADPTSSGSEAPGTTDIPAPRPAAPPTCREERRQAVGSLSPADPALRTPQPARR